MIAARGRRPGPLLRAVAVLAGLLGTVAPATSQRIESIIDLTPMETEAETPQQARGAGVACVDINARAMEASLVIRQHASALSVGFDAGGRAEALVLLSWLDHWTGRLRGLVDLGEYAQCMDEGDMETYRRAAATGAQIGNQARQDLLRTPPPAAAPARQRR